MAGNDLIFELPFDPNLPAQLVFGDSGDVPVQNAEVAIVGKLPGLRGRVRAQLVRSVGVLGKLPGLRGRATINYRSEAARPVVGKTTGRFQQGAPADNLTRASWGAAQHFQRVARVRFEDASKLQSESRIRYQDALKLHHTLQARYERARTLNTGGVNARYQEGVKLHHTLQTRYERALPLNTGGVNVRYQETLRHIRNYTAVRYQDAIPYSERWTERGQTALPLYEWWVGRYQDAMKPPIGMWQPKPPEPPEPCYVPEVPAHLVFSEMWSRSPHLVFCCCKDEPTPEPGETIFVPILEVYLTINSAVLMRVDTGDMIPVFNMSMSLDVDSWTWGFNATVPGAALPFVQRSAHGEPVVVQATVNGIDFRFALDTPTRNRRFGDSTVQVQGRGIGAELDEPNSVVRTFHNAGNRTARQLLDDILTVNGIDIGWNIGLYQPTDYLVPAGVFTHTGTYISAINTVVQAVGGYVQPHNTDRTLDVRLRYPVAPWEWSTVTPDYDIPEDAATQESIPWQDKPLYNRVFVVGQEHGVIGQVTRTGTAGDLVAPTVVDPLITHADAARQRGTMILSDTGRVANITLTMPLLESSGLIKPGSFVHYHEGGKTHIGLTRSVTLNVGLTDTTQTFTMETHII